MVHARVGFVQAFDQLLVHYCNGLSRNGLELRTDNPESLLHIAHEIGSGLLGDDVRDETVGNGTQEQEGIVHIGRGGFAERVQKYCRFCLCG